MARRRALLTYDVSDDRRRARLYKLLRGYGLAVQESVFLLDLSPARWAELERRARALVNATADDVRLWPLCDRCHRDVRAWCGAPLRSLGRVSIV
jgi:CRISPR-associated protein Cas2